MIAKLLLVLFYLLAPAGVLWATRKFDLLRHYNHRYRNNTHNKCAETLADRESLEVTAEEHHRQCQWHKYLRHTLLKIKERLMRVGFRREDSDIGNYYTENI